MEALPQRVPGLTGGAVTTVQSPPLTADTKRAENHGPPYGGKSRPKKKNKDGLVSLKEA